MHLKTGVARLIGVKTLLQKQGNTEIIIQGQTRDMSNLTIAGVAITDCHEIEGMEPCIFFGKGLCPASHYLHMF